MICTAPATAHPAPPTVRRSLAAAQGSHNASHHPGHHPGPGWAEMCSHRAYLVRHAQRKLHDPALAEDVVHDVFEAVLSGRAVFRAESSLRVWLMGTLKHKIVDLIRQRARLDSLEMEDDDGEGGIACPNARPDELAEQRERLAHTLARIQALPESLRIVMQLQVLKDWPTDAVCRTLAISQSNLFVRMHRARKQLTS